MMAPEPGKKARPPAVPGVSPHLVQSVVRSFRQLTGFTWICMNPPALMLWMRIIVPVFG